MTRDDILLIGCGNMGSAMLDGWLAQRPTSKITVIDPNPGRIPPSVRTLTSLADYSRQAKLVVLAVKPQMLTTVAPALERVVGPDTILLSILAAVEIASLRRYFPRAGAIARAVPNLPGAIRAGITALADEGLDSAGRSLVTHSCEPLGSVEWLEHEALIDAATSVSGCGPAFLLRFAAAVIAAGVAQGLEEDQARRLFAATMAGTGKLLATTGETVEDMIRRVSSPGGVTLAGLAILDRDDALGRLIGETLAATARRSAEMAAAAR